jgi:hypothetical protein
MQFRPQTIAAVRGVFDEVCGHIPNNCNSARAVIGSRILESASTGEEAYEGLLAAGRKAVLDQFGSIDVLRAALR